MSWAHTPMQLSYTGKVPWSYMSRMAQYTISLYFDACLIYFIGIVTPLPNQLCLECERA